MSDVIDSRVCDPRRVEGELSLSDCGIGPGELPEILVRLGQLEPLRKLSLNVNPIGPVGAAALVGCSALRSLSVLKLSECQLGPAGASAISSSSALGGLSWLNLSGNALGPEGLQTVAQAGSLGRLSWLDVSWNAGLAVGVKAIAASSAMAKLEKLIIDGNEAGPDGIAAVALSRTLVRLRFLHAASNAIGPDGARVVAASENLSTLEVLELSHNELGCPGMIELSRTLTLTGLSYLCIRANDIGEPGGLAICRSRVCRQLVGLVASTNRLPSSALGALLKNTKMIAELYVDENRIGPDGAAALASSGVVGNLQHLAISSNPIGAQGLAAIARTRCLPRLKDLALGNNGEGREGWAAWIHDHAFPALKRFNFAGTPHLTDRELQPTLRDLLPPGVAGAGGGGSLATVVVRGCGGLGLTDAELDLGDAAELYRALVRKRVAGAAPLPEVKLVILGMGGVGKSSLAARLGGLGRYAGPQTHDVEISRASAPALHPIVGCRLFDFGGQPELHATHRFSLHSRRTCYLVLLDGCRGSEDGGNHLSYWLNLIRHYAYANGSRVPVVVVIGRGDLWEGGTPRAEPADVHREAAGLGLNGGVQVVDRYADPPPAKSHGRPREPEGLDRVREAITAGIDSIDHVARNVDPGFGDALAWVEGRPFFGDPDGAFATAKHVPVERFRRACEVFGATDPGQWALWLRELRDLGAVHWVGDLPEVAEANRHAVAQTVFNPAWVKTPAYLVVRDSPAEEGISRADLLAFLDDRHDADSRLDPDRRSTWGQQNWGPDDREKLLQLMIAYETLFEVRPARTSGVPAYIVPDRLADQRVRVAVPSQAAVELRFDFLPPGTFGRLVAAWPNRVAGGQLCRNQAVLTHDLCPGTSALVTADVYAGNLDVQLAGPNPAGRDRLVTLIRGEVERIVRPAGVASHGLSDRAFAVEGDRPAVPEPQPRYVFRRTARKKWEVAFGKPGVMPVASDGRGLTYIARLLSQPNRPIDVIDLHRRGDQALIKEAKSESTQALVDRVGLAKTAEELARLRHDKGLDPAARLAEIDKLEEEIYKYSRSYALAILCDCAISADRVGCRACPVPR